MTTFTLLISHHLRPYPMDIRFGNHPATKNLAVRSRPARKVAGRMKNLSCLFTRPFTTSVSHLFFWPLKWGQFHFFLTIASGPRVMHGIQDSLLAPEKKKNQREHFNPAKLFWWFEFLQSSRVTTCLFFHAFFLVFQFSPPPPPSQEIGFEMMASKPLLLRWLKPTPPEQ